MLISPLILSNFFYNFVRVMYLKFHSFASLI